MTFVKMIKPLQKILHNNYIFHDKFPYRQSWTFVHNSFMKTCRNEQKSSDRHVIVGVLFPLLKIYTKSLFMGNKQNSCSNN